ncbi:MAG: flagellar basal body L-ring protein FlgH [Bdellovibrionales bacterium]
MKALVGGKASVEGAASKQVKSFNSSPNSSYRGIPRHYKRMTQAKLEAENKIDQDSGSLWVNEGQTSYLFAQNNQRLVGDIVNVQIKDVAKRQLDTKVKVIKNLIDLRKKRKVAAVNRAKTKKAGTATTQPTAPSSNKSSDSKESAFKVEEVPARIVETFPDGSYRVRGSRSFMIDRSEYKVIVTGVVKPTDIQDSKVDSGKVLEPKFDVVSTRRSLKL